MWKNRKWGWEPQGSKVLLAKGMDLNLDPEVSEEQSGKSSVRECHSPIYVWANHSGDKCWRPSYGEVRSCGFKVERRGHVGVESMRAGQQASHLKWNPYIWKEYHCSVVLSFILKSLTLPFKCSWNFFFFWGGKECYFFRQKWLLLFVIAFCIK